MLAVQVQDHNHTGVLGGQFIFCRTAELGNLQAQHQKFVSAVTHKGGPLQRQGFQVHPHVAGFSGLTLLHLNGSRNGALAWVARAKGYKTILTMPDTMSVERRNLLKAFGAEIELTPGAEGMKGAIAKAEEIRQNTPGAVILGQFTNLANPAAHERTTAQEIWRDTDGQVDIFVAGIGTGGTVSGTGKGLKAHKASVQAIGVEPASSAVITTGVPGKHKIQGIGAGFVPQTFLKDYVDSVLTVTDDDAFAGARLLADRLGLLVGISSGAAFSAAYALAKKPENKGKLIVALLPDTGERYLSTPLFER